MKNRKKLICGGIAMLLVLAATAGLTAAYLKSAVGEALNVITVGDIKVQLEEKHWDGREIKPIHPKESVSKDPSVKNTGNNDAYVFLQVDVPKRNISLVDEKTRQKTKKQKNALFTFKAEEGWELISTEEQEEYVRYVYGYTQVLAPGQETPPLFHEITAVNYLEEEDSIQEECAVLVTAQAIQKEVQGKNVREIYQDFLAQEKADKREIQP